MMAFTENVYSYREIKKKKIVAVFSPKTGFKWEQSAMISSVSEKGKKKKRNLQI